MRKVIVYLFLCIIGVLFSNLASAGFKGNSGRCRGCGPITGGGSGANRGYSGPGFEVQCNQNACWTTSTSGGGSYSYNARPRRGPIVTPCSVSVSITPRTTLVETGSKTVYTAMGVPVSYSYSWSLTCGSFSGGSSSQKATWVAPNSPTTCKVSVTYTKAADCKASDSLTVDVKAKSVYWYTSINGDVFAGSLDNLTVYKSPAGDNFKTMLLNVTSSNKTGSYLRSAGDVISAEGNKTIFDAGSGDKKSGYAKSLYDSDNPSSDPTSYWLEQFFDPYTIPTGSYVKKITKISDIKSAGIYKMSDSDFNSSVSTNVTYSLSANDAAVLYIDGDDDLDIKGTIKGNARLIIITPGNVYISKNIGITPITSYTINSSSNIDCGIISGGDKGIVFESNKPVSDIPIMVSSPLVAYNSVQFNRDLRLSSIDYPAESVKYDPTLLYYLTNFERSHGEALTYSGITIFDVQWVYED